MDAPQDPSLLIAPEILYTPSQLQHYETLVQRAQNNAGGVVEAGPYPTSALLHYLVDRKGFLLHGSNQPNIALFQPRSQTDYMGRMVKAVFAANDAVAPVFYAILDRVAYQGSIRNTFRQYKNALGELQPRYRFSIEVESLSRSPWVAGTIYVFERAPFTQVFDEAGQPLLEWMCAQPVAPLMKVRVAPSDFIFLNQVHGHEDRLAVLAHKLLSSYERLQELSDGFAFGYPWSSECAADAAELIRLLNESAPTIQTKLMCIPNQSPLWLHLHGSQDIKDNLRAMLERMPR